LILQEVIFICHLLLRLMKRKLRNILNRTLFTSFIQNQKVALMVQNLSVLFQMQAFQKPSRLDYLTIPFQGIINFIETNNKLIIEVKDNGTGFNLNTIELGNGLENMQHRIKEINEEITIYSEINKGTTITISCLKNKTNAV